MRKLYWVLLAGCVGVSSGCSEVIAPPERATAIDVVGEPADPTTESMGTPDIAGSAPSLPDDAELLTDSKPEPQMPLPFPEEADEPTEGAEEPDVNGGNTVAKPVSLKKQSIDPQSSQDLKSSK